MTDIQSGKPKLALFHIGAPKTATTTLQAWLRGNRNRFGPRGISVFLPRQVRQNQYLAKYMKFYRGKLDLLETEDFLRLFEEDPAETVIVSEEALSNDFIPASEFDNNGFDAVERTIRFLKALEIPQTKVLLTVRRQDKFLKSAYSHRVRRASVTSGFDDWVREEAAVENMSWLKVVDRLEAAFGVRNVSVVPFEMLEVADEKAFYLSCTAPLGLDFSRHMPPKRVDENRSLAAETLQIAGILNALSAKTAGEEDRRRKLINMINNFVLDNGGRSFSVDLSAVTERCQALYKAENEALAARKFPDLDTSFTFPARVAAPEAEQGPEVGPEVGPEQGAEQAPDPEATAEAAKAAPLT